MIAFFWLKPIRLTSNIKPSFRLKHLKHRLKSQKIVKIQYFENKLVKKLKIVIHRKCFYNLIFHDNNL